jgi:hypothetical protein
MTTVESVLRAYGNGINPDDFAGQLERVLRRRVMSDPRALSEDARQVLARVGVPATDLDRSAEQTIVQAAADLLTENSSALPADDAASRLGRSVNRIRGAIADGSLYGVKVGRRWLLPTWQFTNEPAPLPHLRKVVAAIPEGTSALSVQRIMTEPSDELYIDGAPVSPREWLLAGQDAAPVAEMVEQLYAW